MTNGFHKFLLFVVIKKTTMSVADSIILQVSSLSIFKEPKQYMLPIFGSFRCVKDIVCDSNSRPFLLMTLMLLNRYSY